MDLVEIANEVVRRVKNLIENIQPRVGAREFEVTDRDLIDLDRVIKEQEAGGSLATLVSVDDKRLLLVSYTLLNKFKEVDGMVVCGEELSHMWGQHTIWLKSSSIILSAGRLAQLKEGERVGDIRRDLAAAAEFERCVKVSIVPMD